ncbi:2-oxo acid dehydrogenase subunit E2 [bacterium]|nr:MAG: 2-oxo acid dehydrogenase subunit E2 [bacterium]
MAVEILMPELGESVHEGTVSRWLKKVGDFVKEDEPVVEIMTDKVNTELPSPASGILSQILINEGELVEVFKAMGVIEPEGAAGAAETKAVTPEIKDLKLDPDTSVKAEAPASAPVASSDERRFYTPVVRSIAKESGLSDAELSGLAGTGEGGRVTKKDAQVPTVTTVTEVDVTNMVKFRERNKETFLETYGVKLTYTPFFIKALAESLLEYPLVNASLREDNQIVNNSGVHIGVAVALGKGGEGGLIVPVIKDCQSKTLIEIAKDLEGIAAKARSNKLGVGDVQGGTFTLTNPGTYGALFGTPMINSPQAGILGTYTIKKTPVIIDDMIAIRSIMHLVLTYDHRIIDGMLAGKFLAAVRDRLQNFDFFK